MTKHPFAIARSLLLVFLLLALPVSSSAADENHHNAPKPTEPEKMRWTDDERRIEGFLSSGEDALRNKNYEEAAADYKNACDLIPNSPDPQSLYQRALRSFCDANCCLAEQRITEHRYADAEKIVYVVLDERYDPHCRRAVVILSRLEDWRIYQLPSSAAKRRATYEQCRASYEQYRATLERLKQWVIEIPGFEDTGRFTLDGKQ